ncbi:MAG: hypothetical protein EBX47_11075 [Synechococcaceae bacterium WB8_1B_057]|nr:hypothetical protein [Synechococcaceae bacterium WB8_1B_057]
MKNFPFRILSKTGHINKFAYNVTFYKHLVEEEFKLSNIFRILYFCIPPERSILIHQDKDIISKTQETKSYIYILGENNDVYYNTWIPNDDSKIYYKPGPSSSPRKKNSVPYLNVEDAILISSTQLTNNMMINIEPFHNVENRSNKNIAEFLSIRFDYPKSYD